MTTLMEARLQEWHDSAIAQGMRQGMQRGIEQGRQQGVQEGIQRGVQQGIQQGMQQGIQQGVQEGMQQGVQEGIQQGVQQGLQQGVHQGQADLLRRQAERRFDAETARRLSALLAGIEADRLIDVGDWVFECGSGDELLDRVRQAGGSARRKR